MAHKDHKGHSKKHSKVDKTQPQQFQGGPQGPSGSQKSQGPERLQETQLRDASMGDIFTPDRSGVSGVRDRGR